MGRSHPGMRLLQRSLTIFTFTKALIMKVYDCPDSAQIELITQNDENDNFM